jgi:hypothetical protein
VIAGARFFLRYMGKSVAAAASSGWIRELLDNH